MAGLNIQPALAGWLGIVLAGFIVACSGGLLRVLTVCRHHIGRLEFLNAEERRLLRRHQKHEVELAKAAANAAAKAALLTGKGLP